MQQPRSGAEQEGENRKHFCRFRTAGKSVGITSHKRIVAESIESKKVASLSEARKMRSLPNASPSVRGWYLIPLNNSSVATVGSFGTVEMLCLCRSDRDRNLSFEPKKQRSRSSKRVSKILTPESVSRGDNSNDQIS